MMFQEKNCNITHPAFVSMSCEANIAIQIANGQMEQKAISAPQDDLGHLILAAQTQTQAVVHQEPIIFPTPNDVTYLMPGGSNDYISTIP